MKPSSAKLPLLAKLPMGPCAKESTFAPVFLHCIFDSPLCPAWSSFPSPVHSTGNEGWAHLMLFFKTMMYQNCICAFRHFLSSLPFSFHTWKGTFFSRGGAVGGGGEWARVPFLIPWSSWHLCLHSWGGCLWKLRQHSYAGSLDHSVFPDTPRLCSCAFVHTCCYWNVFSRPSLHCKLLFSPQKPAQMLLSL